MSDGAISQDEIDALLSGVDLGGGGGGSSSSGGAVAFASFDTGVLSNFVSGTVDTFADSLKTMTGSDCTIEKPSVEILVRDDVLKKLPEMVVAVMTDFSAGLTGDHLFIMDPELAKKITSLVNKEETPELDEMALSVVSEAVSQQVGTEITHLGRTGKLPGLASRPAEPLHVPKAMVRFPQDSFPVVSYNVTLDGNSYTIWEAFSNEAATGITSALSPDASPAGGGSGMLSPSELAGLGSMNPGMGAPMGGGAPMGMAMGAPMGDAMSMGGMAMPGMNVPNVQSVQYPSLQQTAGTMEQGNIGLIMDVYMEMTVELGRTKKQIKEILGMGEGTIIELDKLAGEPVDILVNHKPIAKGEVVVIDENFGVRVTEILSPSERVSDLR